DPPAQAGDVGPVLNGAAARDRVPPARTPDPRLPRDPTRSPHRTGGRAVSGGRSGGGPGPRLIDSPANSRRVSRASVDSHRGPAGRHERPLGRPDRLAWLRGSQRRLTEDRSGLPLRGVARRASRWAYLRISGTSSRGGWRLGGHAGPPPGRGGWLPGAGS